MTLRDEVWKEVIHKLVTDGEFKISELPFEEGQRHTIRRVLREMERMGYLERTSEQSSIWRLGELAELHLNIPDEKRSRVKSR